MKVEQMASVTFTGTPEEISRVVSLAQNSYGKRLIDNHKIPMVKVIHESTGISLLKSKQLAEKILATITA